MGRSNKNVTGHQLYYFSTCPFCLVVRIALWRLGLKIPLKETMFHPKNNTELVAGGGKSQVPCLRIENRNGDIQWMYESIDIIQYLRKEFAT
jgi:glutathione S-transferase